MKDILYRGGPDKTPEEQRRADAQSHARVRAWVETTEKLCNNSDFAVWLYGVLDDLGLFDRLEAPVGEFGQGFRAAANRIRNRMLEAPKAVQLFTDLTKRHHAELHRRLVADRQKQQTEN